MGQPCHVVAGRSRRSTVASERTRICCTGRVLNNKSGQFDRTPDGRNRRGGRKRGFGGGLGERGEHLERTVGTHLCEEEGERGHEELGVWLHVVVEEQHEFSSCFLVEENIVDVPSLGMVCL